MTTQQQRHDVFQLVGLVAVAGVLVFLGAISVVNRVGWQEPTDGVVWAEQDGELVVEEVVPGGPGDRAGLMPGDRLISIGGVEVTPPDPLFVDAVLWNQPIGSRIEYRVARMGRTVSPSLLVGARSIDNRPYYYLVLVGAAFLVMGVFSLFNSTHREAGLRFFALAVAFYAVLVLSPTRESDPLFDVIFWVEEIALNLLPGLFLWFALTFPDPKRLYRRHRARWLAGAFGPGAVLLLGGLGVIAGNSLLGLSGQTRYWFVESFAPRVQLVYLAVAFSLGILLFAHTYKEATSPVQSKRMKWLVGGSALGLFPFVALYVPLYVLGIRFTPLMDLAVLPLLLVPLFCGYAVVGFRPWDVEVILKRGTTYAVSTLAVLGLYLGCSAVLTWLFEDDVSLGFVRTAALGATLVAAVAFAPLRERVQEMVDRLYYRERYRARRTLIDFGRELNSELDLDQIVELLTRRVRETLGVGKVAVLFREEEEGPLQLISPSSRRERRDAASHRQLSATFSQFLTEALRGRDFLYVDDLDSLLDEYPDDRETLQAEDLAYFLPLIVKNRVVGVLALGRTLSGDYLSSEDMEVLQPLTSHAALAIDNAMLYEEAERRARELERLKSYNENIVESIKVGVMVLDLEGRVLSWNQSLERLSGLSSEEAVDTAIDDLFPDAFVAEIHRVRRRVEEGDEDLASAFRVAFETRDGDERVVNLSVAPLLGDHGRHGTVIIVDDVTERTELESQLRQSEKLASVGLLAAGVAHEVNTPLAGISSYVQMLQRKLGDDDPRRPILEKIEKQTFRASQIVNNLLNFSRQETGEFRSVSLNELVEETLNLAEVQLSKRDIRTTLDLGENIDEIYGDPGRLQQVLMNLLLNARDAMPGGGELHVATEQHNGQIVLEVTDTGEGISSQNIDKIYDPFFTTKHSGEGTGLGLSVSYGIVQEHRGTIDVDSEVGEGTRFRVRLPVDRDSRRRAAS